VGRFSPLEEEGLESEPGVVREEKMEVILKEDIINIGKIGEVVRVRDGYARNYLLPRGLVLIANKKNLKTFEHHKKLVADQKQKITRQAQAVSDQLSGVALTISVRTGEEGRLFGSVTNIQIEKALKAKGLNVDRRKIHLNEPIKTLGEYEIPIRLTADVTVPLRLSVVAEDGGKAAP
jgi:large subunit ribosomal protein L9